MKRIHALIALFIIIAIGTFFRFHNLTTVPPSLSHDETAIAYNAYSILKTGRDEYGVVHPLLFRSFDDYKLPGMVYASIPAVAVFGLTAMGARFTSAFLGTLTLLIFYLLVYELVHKPSNGKTIEHEKISQTYALVSTLFFAISPWHINFSRQLFESNGALFFITLATYTLLKSRRNIRYLLMASILFGISVYFYYSVRLVIPFILLAYALISKKVLLEHKKFALAAVCVFLFTIAPIGRLMFSPDGLERVTIVSLANDPNYHKWKDIFIQRYATHQNIINKIFFNQRTAFVMTAVDNYWKNITPLQVFESGTNTYGLQHPFEIPLLFLGVLFLFRYENPEKWIFIAWLASAFLPGALSTNQPNALRTLLASPIISLLSGIGAVEFFSVVEKRKRILFGVIPFSLLIMYFLYVFYQTYFIVNPTRNALAFGDGYEQMIEYVTAHEKQYDRVVISGYYWRPYIFMLYWAHIDPALYQQAGNSRHSFGKYLFTGAEWDKNDIFLYDSSYDPKKLVLTTTEKTLYILAYPEFEKNRARYTQIDTISGRHVPSVFIAALVDQN